MYKDCFISKSYNFYDISIKTYKEKKKKLRRSPSYKSRYVDPKALIKEEDLDDIILWHEEVYRGLNSLQLQHL